MTQKVMQAVSGILDFFYCYNPQAIPSTEDLVACKVISHRGEHNNTDLFENTIPAFDRAVESGVWGVECDVRWTRDLHPVVIHDYDLRRLYGVSTKINSLKLGELKNHFPLVPTLNDIVERYGKKTHIMIELKKEHFPKINFQKERLTKVLSPLTPGEHFHILSLDLEIFPFFDIVPESFMLPVSEINTELMSQEALKNGFGGIAGHYFLISNSKLSRHKKRKQKVGTGFITSKNCLYREINRGVDWIFTNDSQKIMKLIDKTLTQLSYYGDDLRTDGKDIK